MDFRELSFVGLVPGIDLKDYRIFKDMIRMEIEEEGEMEEDDFEMEEEEKIEKDPRLINRTFPPRGVGSKWSVKKRYN